MDEAQRKRISEKVGLWDKFKVSITPGDISEKGQRLKEIADANERDEAMQEAIRRKRMQAGQ